ncbi:hypothetical protein DUNSADRAFT_4982 [Dunaliella salina]|uniref:Uncharacterized protein n=1 Tax=Dunaliella salina TaxID=3046 RepID=A0ABQ7GQX3_DUNSA|nr:hypothetical protein DUNSADRAFT_4982 [Dunaliella salina]|eukprot:KAF5837009.1 hypothetical protein DUNSADRAFT_4982 [Dunaliella salina]
MGQEASAQKPVKLDLPPPKPLHTNDQLAKEAEVDFKRTSAKAAEDTVGFGETVGTTVFKQAKWWGQGLASIVTFPITMFFGTKEYLKKEEEKHELPASRTS